MTKSSRRRARTHSARAEQLGRPVGSRVGKKRETSRGSEFPPADCSDDDRLALEERAAIMEFDGGLSRDDAEQAALKALRWDKQKRENLLRDLQRAESLCEMISVLERDRLS